MSGNILQVDKLSHSVEAVEGSRQAEIKYLESSLPVLHVLHYFDLRKFKLMFVFL